MSFGSVLITGGSGAFGSAFTKRLLRDNLSDRICIYSRGEHAQARLRDELGNDPRLRFFIGDVRDRERLRRAMRGVDLVVHAAALKRIEVGASDPIEMVKTNVLGAVNVIEASQDADVGRVVALSTDKASTPVSPYGQSKALAEALFLAANNTVGPAGPRYVCCRYGNVWASQGSIVPKWAEIINNWTHLLPPIVPVSDPTCTRFWMSMEQAVDLVLEAANNIRSKDLFLPKEMPAYAVGDLAKAMGVRMDIRGLPDWEKHHEEIEPGKTSDKARRMTVAELRGHLPWYARKMAMEAAE